MYFRARDQWRILMGSFDFPGAWVYLNSGGGARGVVGAVFVHQGSVRQHHGVPHEPLRLTEGNRQEPLCESKEQNTRRAV